jgi:hypothetical protein
MNLQAVTGPCYPWRSVGTRDCTTAEEIQMHRILTIAVAAIALCIGALLNAGAASAAFTENSQPLSFQSLSTATAGSATPSDSASPTGPVDPGTGETGEAKETRVDYAPYVIGAVVLAVLLAAVIVWRRRGGAGPSSKGPRRADT